MIFIKYVLPGVLVILCLNSVYSQMDFLKNLALQMQSQDFSDKFKKTYGQLFDEDNSENTTIQKIPDVKVEQPTIFIDLPVYNEPEVEITTKKSDYNTLFDKKLFIVALIFIGIFSIGFTVLFTLHYYNKLYLQHPHRDIPVDSMLYMA